MKINIETFFCDEAKRLANLRVQAEEASKKCSELKQERLTVWAALRDKRELNERAKKEGLDTAKLEEVLPDLEARHEALTSQIDELSKVQSEADAPKNPSFDRELTLARYLARTFKCREGIEVADIRECYSHFTVRIHDNEWADFNESAVRPRTLGAFATTMRQLALGDLKPGAKSTTIDILMGTMCRLSAHVVATSNADSISRPRVLGWLPSQVEDSTTSSTAVVAFLDRSKIALILSSTAFRAEDGSGRLSLNTNYHPPQAGFYHKRLTRETERGFQPKDVALSLEDHARAQLDRVGDHIDLGRSYEDNELVEVIRRKTLALTPEGLFKTSRERLATTAISERVKEDWGALVACPWTAEVTGPLALLKYLVENGEKPRFWSEDHEGHYGFRLRTRDHSWLVGELFVMPGEPVATGRLPMTVTMPQKSFVGTLGRLHILVSESQ